MGAGRKKLYVDLVLFFSYVAVSIPQSTGVPFHEWLSLLFVVPFLLHILLNWRWVVSTSRRIFARQPAVVRFNYAWDLLIFSLMVFSFLSGLLVSEAVLPALGLTFNIDPFWMVMHHQSSNLLVLLIGVHLAMHWRWIIGWLKRRGGAAATEAGS